MNFQNIFLAKLLSGDKLTSALTVSQFLPTTYPLQPDEPECLLSLTAAGYIKSCYPYRYEIMDLPFFCILYTIKGSGMYEVGQKKYCLLPGTFLFVDCEKKHKIYAEKNSWDFYQLFLYKTQCLFFYKQFTIKYGSITTIPQCPYIISLFSRLTAEPFTLNRDLLFNNHRLLTEILTAAILTPSAYRDDFAPPYLRKMKKIMDTQYASPQSLTQFEMILGISRYRLSREFHNLYELPPLQYLNRRRIEESKKLLQDPAITVYEAGRLVGIDNTTHFIRLFRKYAGTTPANYRSSLQS
ncbi:AraC family transcriptional regulator [Clostridium sp. E02]|uniref:AraC family transcriptional regulator n=1 Tax=Clostridium sp. E02 TaxID=2487134 RepID=UPI000F52BD50|nr:AraC family transcriptional regulator [Clostridium sp. E02]